VFEKGAPYFGNEDIVNMPSLDDQNLMNSTKMSGHKLEKQEEYSNAITYKGEDGQEYIVLEVMDEPDNEGESRSPEGDLQTFSTISAGLEEYKMFNAVSLTEFLTPVNNTNSLHVDNIVSPNYTTPINNQDNLDYSTLIPNETLTTSNHSTKLSLNSFTSTANVVTTLSNDLRLLVFHLELKYYSPDYLDC
jgi:hypothetical protein